MSRLRYMQHIGRRSRRRSRRRMKGSCGEGRRRCRSGERKARIKPCQGLVRLGDQFTFPFFSPSRLPFTFLSPSMQPANSNLALETLEEDAIESADLSSHLSPPPFFPSRDPAKTTIQSIPSFALAASLPVLHVRSIRQSCIYILALGYFSERLKRETRAVRLPNTRLSDSPDAMERMQ